MTSLGKSSLFLCRVHFYFSQLLVFTIVWLLSHIFFSLRQIQKIDNWDPVLSGTCANRSRHTDKRWDHATVSHPPTWTHCFLFLFSVSLLEGCRGKPADKNHLSLHLHSALVTSLLTTDPGVPVDMPCLPCDSCSYYTSSIWNTCTACLLQNL